MDLGGRGIYKQVAGTGDGDIYDGRRIAMGTIEWPRVKMDKRLVVLYRNVHVIVCMLFYLLLVA